MLDAVNSALDRIEERLPELPRRALQIQRTLIGFGIDAAALVYHEVTATFASVTRVTGADTVVGTARTAAEQIGDEVGSGVRTIAGRARSAAEEVAGRVTETAERLVDGDEAALDRMTKAELYQRARELDIEGRSTMSKRQLIGALAGR